MLHIDIVQVQFPVGRLYVSSFVDQQLCIVAPFLLYVLRHFMHTNTYVDFVLACRLTNTRDKRTIGFRPRQGSDLRRRGDKVGRFGQEHSARTLVRCTLHQLNSHGEVRKDVATRRHLGHRHTHIEASRTSPHDPSTTHRQHCPSTSTESSKWDVESYEFIARVQHVDSKVYTQNAAHAESTNGKCLK